MVEYMLNYARLDPFLSFGAFAVIIDDLADSSGHIGTSGACG